MNIVSLFDGISCGAVALERAGIKIGRYAAYEIDENAIKVSEQNYPKIERYGNVFEGEFERFAGFDMLMGGSPCTYWSIARCTSTEEKRTKKCEGPGWELFKQYKRALDEIEPKYFIYENNASISPIIKNKISEESGVNYLTINSRLVSAQDRRRCYWTNIPVVGMPEDREIYFRDVISRERSDMRQIGEWVHGLRFGKTKLAAMKRLDCEKSGTLTTSKYHPGNYYLNDNETEYTNLTAEEWEILQTLPQGYTSILSGEKRYKAIGNGWTVDVIAWILSFIPEEERI